MDATCEDRIEEHRVSRLAHIRQLLAVAGPKSWDEDEDGNWEDREAYAAAVALHEDGEIDSPLTNSPDDLSEEATERMWELPLGVSESRVYRIDLSTGGPGDWYEVHADDDKTVTRIVYHFNDWFDHAERTLDGDEFDAIEEFARRVVPGLIE